MTARLTGPAGPRWLTSSWAASLQLCATAALWTLALGNPAESTECRWLDVTLRIRHHYFRKRSVDPRIIILSIDDEDQQAMEDEYFATGQLLREALNLGAAVVAFDAIYLAKSPASAASILDAANQGTPIVWAEAMRPIPGAAPGMTQRLRSFPFLTERLRPYGIINAGADKDGVHRRYSLIERNGSVCEPSFALACYFALKGLAWGPDVRQTQPGTLTWPELSADGANVIERQLHETIGAPRLLNFRGGWANGGGFRHLTMRDLHALDATAKIDQTQPLSGDIILVARLSTGIADLGATAFGPSEPLILLHATALDDLLQNTFLIRAPRWGDAVAFFPCVALLTFCFRYFARKRWLLVLWAAGSGMIFAIGALFIFRLNLVLPTVDALMLWTIATFVEVGRRHSLEFLGRVRLRNTMGYYFSPRVLNHVLRNPGSMEPHEAEITALLSDLRNSTPLAELLGPIDLFRLLNQVFETETRAVMAEDGSLEHFLGDQFLAYWGAPDPQEDHADRALRAALKLIEGMESVRSSPELTSNSRSLFGYGVALHSGKVLIGNRGSAQRLDYGVVGDLINAAARVESLTKFYKVLLLATRETFERFTEKPEHRLLDRVIVKGKTEPLELIELRHALTSADSRDIWDAYARAFGLYQIGNFAEAATSFRQLGAVDHASLVLAERCEEFAIHPPVTWSGAYKLEIK